VIRLDDNSMVLHQDDAGDTGRPSQQFLLGPECKKHLPTEYYRPEIPGEPL
jgi:hypothetical protein